MSSITLYNCPPSGNCYKIRLFAALTGIDLNISDIDLPTGEHKQAWFSKLNPWQQVPVLKVGDVVIWDAQAILVYLAKAYRKDGWFPTHAADQGKVMQWLSVAANEIQHGPASARLVKLFGYPLRYHDAVKASERVLGVVDGHLSANQWLASDRPTIADCAAYPYLALAPQGDIALDPYPSLRRWIADVEALPGYIRVDQ